MTLRLPLPDGSTRTAPAYEGSAFVPPKTTPTSRRFLAAAHVVADPLSGGCGTPDQIDFDRTLEYRRHLWAWGLGVAEAMDTAQRGMGLSWATARLLIPRSIAEAKACNGDLVIGVQTDHLEPGSARTLRDVEIAYEEQVSFVTELGGRVVLMASRELARIARSPDDYAQVYSTVLSRLTEPAIIHWLGDVFDPALAGYWGHSNVEAATDVLLDIIRDHTEQVDGVKLSLLDREAELAMRERLPEGVRLYTGDDFDYPGLILGDGTRHSDALLGVLDPIAPAAATALQALDAGDDDSFESILEPTLPLARKIFEAPTYYYKTGITLIAFLNGRQPHFRMLDGLESSRSLLHLADVYRLTGEAGLLEDPEGAAHRIQLVMALGGVSQ